MPRKEIEAIDLIALEIDARDKQGTPDHAKAVRLLEKSKKMWLEKFNPKRCRTCGHLKGKSA